MDPFERSHGSSHKTPPPRPRLGAVMKVPPLPSPQLPSPQPSFAPLSSAPSATAARAPAALSNGSGYGIERAIELMRKLPKGKAEVEVLVQVVKVTLESANIRVQTILEDAA